MKKQNKTKDEQIFSLKSQLTAREESESFFAILFLIAAIAFTTITIALCNMDSKFNEKKELVSIYKEKIQLANEHTNALIEKDAFVYKCSELAKVSKKPFEISIYGLRCVDYSDKTDLMLLSIQEIEDAIRHYKLGEKGK